MFVGSREGVAVRAGGGGPRVLSTASCLVYFLMLYVVHVSTHRALLDSRQLLQWDQELVRVLLPPNMRGQFPHLFRHTKQNL